MKPYFFIFLFLFASSLNAQFVYYDASAFPLLGKISTQTETLYERLPESLKNVTRGPVWDLGKNTAGLAVRFSSNSSQIAAKWELYMDRSMDHMAFTGIKGLDLYCWEGGKWIFVNTARPETAGKKQEALIISNMEIKDREYMLYLPLYDGVISLKIGIDSTCVIEQPKKNIPNTLKPVVCYGTSILQGGCASRPGMAHSNILSRRFNREFINLGFSGNGQLDYEIAEIISDKHNAGLIILDFMPNVDVLQIQEKMEKFYYIIRHKLPDVPIIFIENPIFPHGKFDINMQTTVEEKNKALHAAFKNLESKGEKNILLISSEKMIGNDGEATVDGIHFTDLGFMRYADYLYPYLEKFLGE